MPPVPAESCASERGGARHVPMLAGLAVLAPDSVKLQPVAFQLVAQPGGDPLLQRFDFGVNELEDFAGVEVDQMVMMVALGILVARASVPEFVLLQDSRLFEELDGPVDRGQRDSRVDGAGPGIELFDVRMVCRLFKNRCNDAALVRQAQSQRLASLEYRVRHARVSAAAPCSMRSAPEGKANGASRPSETQPWSHSTAILRETAPLGKSSWAKGRQAACDIASMTWNGMTCTMPAEQQSVPSGGPPSECTRETRSEACQVTRPQQFQFA